MRERDEVNTPEAYKILFRQLRKLRAKYLKYRIPRRPDAVRHHYFAVLQKKIWKKVDKNTKQSALPEPFVPGIRSTRSLRRSVNADVSMRAPSSKLSNSATDEPKSKSWSKPLTVLY